MDMLYLHCLLAMLLYSYGVIYKKCIYMHTIREMLVNDKNGYISTARISESENVNNILNLLNTQAKYVIMIQKK